MHPTISKRLFTLTALGFATLLSSSLPAAAPAGGGATRGAGRAGGAPAPQLTIENLKTALTLTDEQVAMITPWLDSMNQGQQALNSAQTANTEARTLALAVISAELTDAQKPLLAQLYSAAPGGAGRGAPAAQPNVAPVTWKTATPQEAAVAAARANTSDVAATPPHVFPTVKFDLRRPIPPEPGNVRDPETLLLPPEGLTIQRRNNFYDNASGGNATGTGLYRWASSGHWSNYDEKLAGESYKNPPDPLKFNNGQIVGTPAQWTSQRRAEVMDLVETNIFGKVPANVPKVTWTSSKVTNADGSITTTALGTYVNADGTPFVASAGAGGRGGRGGGGANITVTYTIPAGATGAVPLIQGGNAQQIYAMGFGTLNIGGNAPNVSSGRPDDWGAIRKVAWVNSRGLDFLETDPTVDAHQTAFTGHSIGGKQALMKGVMDERVGLVFASCSGEGGASMMRRDWGETIDDIGQLSPGNYCANFQKWVGNWDAMPADANMLVALMAPRPLLITGGTDDQWSDPVGVFWSGVSGGKVYKLLGAGNFPTANPPAPNTFVGDGALVHYNHIGGHTPMPAETARYHEMIQKYFKIVPFGTHAR